MAKNSKTSKKKAGRQQRFLRDPKSTKIGKSVAGSALTQALNKKTSSKK
jgi:hypothetical protein